MRNSLLQVVLSCVLLCTSALVVNGVPLVITAGPALSHAGNLIQNGSFEGGFTGTPSVGNYWASGTANTPFQAVTGWTSNGGPVNYAMRADTQVTQFSPAVPDGNVALYFGNGLVNSISQMPTFNPDGSLTFSSSPTIVPGLSPAVTIQQTVSGLSTSNTYALSFWAAGEYSGVSPTSGSDGIFAMDVTGFSTTYLTVPSGVTGSVGSQLVYRFEFQPTSSTTTFTFTNWGHFSGLGGFTTGWTIPEKSTELVMDDVILNDLGHSDIVPEPASLGLMAVTTLGLLHRRSRRS